MKKAQNITKVCLLKRKPSRVVIRIFQKLVLQIKIFGA